MGAVTIAEAAALTMSSRDIADLLECRHDNVKRTIDRLSERGVIGVPPLEEYRDALGRPAMQHRLGKRDSYVVVAQLSPEFTGRLVDRWQELEARVAAPDPMAVLNDPAAMRTLLLGYTEKVLALETTVRQQAPKVELADTFLAATNGVGGDIAARELSKDRPIGRGRLYAFLRERGVFMPNTAVPYQHHVDAGRFFMQATTYPGPDGKLQQAASVRFTTKGIAFCRALLAKHQSQAAQAAEH